MIHAMDDFTKLINNYEINKVAISDPHFEDKVNHIANKIKNGDYKTFLFDPGCQYHALAACQMKHITVPEFCSILSLRQLIEDMTTQGLNYAEIETLENITIFNQNSLNTKAIAMLQKSLKLQSNGYLNENSFKRYITEINDAPLFEKTFFVVKLNDKCSWPTALKILCEFSKSFSPIQINDDLYLLIPSFTMRKLFAEIAFGKDNATVPIPVLGNVDMQEFLNLQQYGGRVIGYNFPGHEPMIEADMTFTGKFYFTEHDWSHLEESSMTPHIDRKLYTEINRVILYGRNQLVSTVKDNIIIRIFDFGNLESEIYKIFWNDKPDFLTSENLWSEYNINEVLRYSCVLYTLFQILGLPYGCSLKLHELLAIEKCIYGFNSKNDGEIKLLSPEVLTQQQDDWNKEMALCIKELLTDFVINEDAWKKNYAFDPNKLDWELELKETEKIVEYVVARNEAVYKVSLDDTKQILKKMGNYYKWYRKAYQQGKNVKVTSATNWVDPVSNVSFQHYEIHHVEFHIGKGLILKKKVIC